MPVFEHARLLSFWANQQLEAQVDFRARLPRTVMQLGYYGNRSVLMIMGIILNVLGLCKDIDECITVS